VTRIPVFGLLRMGWRDGIFAGIILTAAITAACGCFGPAAAQTAQASPLCGGEELARGTVSRVIDGLTFVLGDGREVRLAAIEVPPLQTPQSSRPDSGQESGAVPDSGTAKRPQDALAALTEGDEVLLRRAEAAADRYGRVLAYAYTERDGDELFVQGELIGSGLAGSAIASAAAPAPRTCSNARMPPGPPSLASGPIRIMRCSTPRSPRMYWRIEADLRWSRVGWFPCVKAGPRYT
jgi:endonuclease YncB( thermonuclease family)